MKKVLKVSDKIANSYWFDLIGLFIIIGGCVALGYTSENLTVTPAWKMNSGFAHIFPAMLPIGILSIISAVFSLESDRFESRLSNLGNIIGIPSILLSMFVDIMFGNEAAWITYPITMVIQIVAVKVWSKTDKYKVAKPLRGRKAVIILVLLSVASLLFSYLMNNMGFNGSHNIIFWTTTLAFAISIIANLAEMLKMQFNNKAWAVYNIVQLGKASAQLNIANVLKYIYYIANNLVSIVSWSAFGRNITKAQVQNTAKK